MENSVLFSSTAQKELAKSANWYEERSEGLGERFTESIYASANAVARNPDAYQIKRKKRDREFVVRDFPFVIVYEYWETEQNILILHVFHTSRHPKRKR